MGSLFAEVVADDDAGHATPASGLHALQAGFLGERCGRAPALGIGPRVRRGPDGGRRPEPPAVAGTMEHPDRWV